VIVTYKEKKKSTPIRSALYNVVNDYLLFEKHSLQNTGRSSLGWKGTLQGAPHSAQTASYISRGALSERPLDDLRASRQALQRCGSLVKPFSA
jgi:hypothetical protein